MIMVKVNPIVTWNHNTVVFVWLFVVIALESLPFIPVHLGVRGSGVFSVLLKNDSTLPVRNKYLLEA
jgi:hypothetical protein